MTMAEDIEGKLASQEIRETVIKQYTDCTKALNELFSLAPDQCHKTDGLGCCNHSTISIEFGISGPAYISWMKMRNERLSQEGLTLKNLREAPCTFHKADVGCILGELKSPTCMAVYCEGELKELGYDSRYVFDTLSKIMLGGGLDKGTGMWHPERNEALTQEFKAYVNGLKEQLQARYSTVS